MITRLEFMEKEKILVGINGLKQDFVELSEKYTIMLNLFLKYKKVLDQDIIKKILTLEREVYEKEKAAYYKLYIICKDQFGYNK